MAKIAINPGHHPVQDTNPKEEALLADAKVRQRAAKAIAEAVDKWLGG
jgi:hypothetical protein